MRFKTKHFLILALTVMFAITSIFSLPAYAQDIPENPNGETIVNIDSNSTLHINNGYVNTNYGTIDINNGEVGENAYMVITNNRDITCNSGTVVNNYGTVSQNFGDVTLSSTSATITENKGGDVYYSADGCIIRDWYNGTLHSGENGNTITITNCYVNDFVNRDDVNITNQFHEVALGGTTGLNVVYAFNDPNADADGLNAHTRKRHTSATNPTGTFTLTPQAGYQITDNGLMEGENTEFGYLLTKNNDGSYTVLFTSISQDIEVTPGSFNLLVSLITNPSEPSQGNGSGNSDGSIMTEDELALMCYLTEEGADGVIDLYFGEKINLTVEIFRYLCEKISAPKRCHYTYQGREWIVFIPAFNTNTTAYLSALAKFTAEEQPVGFLYAKDILSDLGAYLIK